MKVLLLIHFTLGLFIKMIASVLMLAAFALLWLEISTAPEGREDEEGYHNRNKKK